jgi:hypothetical protein
MTRTLMVYVTALSTCGPAIAAEISENGRYQAVALAGQYPEVLILDTRDGHIWRYWKEPRMGKAQGSEGLRYILQIRPGTKSGEIIGSETYRSPS